MAKKNKTLDGHIVKGRGTDMTESMEYDLSVEIASWLESESNRIDEAIMCVNSEDDEDLHELMAKAAMNVYKERVLRPTPNPSHEGNLSKPDQDVRNQ